MFPELAIYTRTASRKRWPIINSPGCSQRNCRREHSKAEAQQKQIADPQSRVADLAKLKQQVAELTQLRAEIGEQRRLTAAQLSCSGQHESCRADAIRNSCLFGRCAAVRSMDRAFYTIELRPPQKNERRP